MSLGQKIKELRLKKGVSLQVVADAVGASKPHIWELERGSSKNPSLELVTKLANYFGVSIDYLANMQDAGNEKDMEIQAFARELGTKNLSKGDLDFLMDAADRLSKTKMDDNS